MPWLAALGGMVMGAFGATVATIAAYSGVAMAIGGAIVGAGVGALYAGLTDGNILEGALYGAVGGAVVGYGASAFVGAGSAAGGTSGLATVSYGTTGGQALGTAATSTSILGGQGAGSLLTKGATTLFTTKEGLGLAGGAMTLGSAFLKGGAQIDPDAQLASNEKIAEANRTSAEKIATDRNATTMGVAQTNLAGTNANIKSNEKIAFANLAETKAEFRENFDEAQWQDRENRKEIETGRQRFEAGIADASSFVNKNTEKVSLVESSRRRKSLPSPTWTAAKTSATSTAVNQSSTGILSQATGATA